MAKKIYNKLVRDNIINIIENDHKTCHFKILNEKEYIDELNNKLNEEVKEYNIDNSLEELADIQEVIDHILIANHISKEEFKNIQLKKASKNGSFKKRYYLIDVED